MSPKLYMAHASPPVRATRMTAKALNVNLDLIAVNLLTGDHKKPEYLKINPQHTVPTLVDDDGFTIWDSHAIIAYLASKYGKNDSLYPKDLKKRALVDQRLHFDSGVLFPKLLAVIKPLIYSGKKTIDQADKDGMVEAYAFLEAFLEGKEWLAGDSVTIADFSAIATTSSANTIVPIDKQKFPRVTAWLKKAESLPAYEVNKAGLEQFSTMMKSLLA